MLSHQVQRMGSPCAGVTNTDAQYFPDLWAPSDEHKKEPFRFHRVLCDVPCSGDGTMRKTPYIWKSWNKRDGIALHIRQLNILYRGLDVLQVGGRLVYSTCSLNPIEDEAVVAAALTRHGDALCLVPPPPLEGMRKAAGLQTWLYHTCEKKTNTLAPMQMFPQISRMGSRSSFHQCSPPLTTSKSRFKSAAADFSHI